MIKKIQNLFLFFLWPFLMVYVTFTNLRLENLNSYSNFSRSILLFLGFFGVNYYVYDGMNSDDHRFLEDFIYFQHSIHSISDLYVYVSTSKAPLEYVFPILTFIVSHLTHNSIMFFTSMALFFGYFYSKNILFILSNSNFTNLFNFKLVLIVFLFIFPFWDSINGFRFATASHMLFYYLMKIYDVKTKTLHKFSWKYLKLIFPIFMHSSILLPILCLPIILFLYSNSKLYFYIFIFSWCANNFQIVNNLNISKYMSSLNLGSENQKKSLDLYLNDDYKQLDKKAGNSVNWNVKLQSNLLNYIILILSILFYLHIRKIPEYDSRLFNYALLLMSLGLFLGIEVSSFGRYMKPGILLLCFSVISANQIFESVQISFIFRALVLIYFVLVFRLSFDLIPLNSMLPIFSVFNGDKLKLVEWWEKYGGIND